MVSQLYSNCVLTGMLWWGRWASCVYPLNVDSTPARTSTTGSKPFFQSLETEYTSFLGRKTLINLLHEVTADPGGDSDWTPKFPADGIVCFSQVMRWVTC